MKLSQVKKRLVAARTVSTEQGDISITVNQGENENPAVDPAASMPPELTDPTASIADQPEVTDTLAEVESDKADALDATDTDAELGELDAGVTAGEEAVEALESFRVHIATLRASGMPISRATVESLTVGIEHAVGRFNLKAADMGIPSTESFTANSAASLESLDKQITASMEGIFESINTWFIDMGDKMLNLYANIDSVLQKQRARLSSIKSSAGGLVTVDASALKLTDSQTLGKIDAATYGATDSKSIAKALAGVNAGLIDALDNRLPKLDAACEKAITDVTAGNDLGSVQKGFETELANVTFADDRTIRFWHAITPVTASFMANIIALPAAWAIYKAATGKLTHKVPAPIRSKKEGKPIINEISVLSGSDLISVVDATDKALEAAIKANSDLAKRRKEFQGRLNGNFAKAKAENENAAKSLESLRYMLRLGSNLESAILRGIRYSVPGQVDYLVACVKSLEAAEKSNDGGVE